MNTQRPLRLRAILAFTFIGTAACMSSSILGSTGTPSAPVTPIDSLVDTQWLSEHLGEPDLVLLDCSVIIESDGEDGFRPASGRSAYETGHLPTAGFADLFGDLSDSDSPYGFAVPSHEQFVSAMEALGVGDNSRVVLYDNSNSAWAARVWWMLRWAGFDNAAILDGGQSAWMAESLPLSRKPVLRPAGQLSTLPRPELIVDRDAVLNVVETGSATLIDSLPEPQYSGKMSMYDRPGHITGAINVSVNSLRDESGYFKSADDLAALFGDERESISDET